jgi:O-antigen/teichoic acid export membrane protein
VSYAGQALLIVLFFGLGVLSGTTALYALAATSALSALFGFWLARRDFVRPARKTVREMWQFGRWLLGDGIGGFLSTQLYPIITAAIVGVSGVGVLRAVQNLIAVGHVIMNAFLAYVVPRASRIQDSQGTRAMKAFVFKTSAVAGVPLIVYWASVSILAVPVLKLLYGETYANYGPLVALTALGYIVQYVTFGQSAALLSLGRTNTLVGGRLVAILLTFTVGIVLVWWIGVYGAVIGSAISLLGLSLFLAHSLGRTGVEAREPEALAYPKPSEATAGGEV